MLPKPNPKEIDRKARMALPDTVIPKQDPVERRGNFDEVYLPFDEESARAAAERCIQCPGAKCVKACPLHNDIPLALWHIEHGQFEEAARIFRQTSTLSEVCGRVCPQIIQCEGSCIYVKKGAAPVAIGRLEAFAADYLKSHSGISEEKEPPTGHRAAVVGAGPAGLTVAELLARKGHSVTVYDAWPSAGGIMRYGIPTFKMSHQLCDDKAELLEKLGIQFVFDTTVGKNLSVDDLQEQGFETIFLGVGAGVSTELKIPGADLRGVYTATPFLIRANVTEALRSPEMKDPAAVGERVAVIGGGDTAMDCLRTSVRLGAREVTCVYRRTEAEMPGNEKDRALAREEGVDFKWLTQPVQLVGDEDGRVTAMKCLQMELGEPDDSGRRRPVPIEGSEFTLTVDTVILALGYQPDPLIADTTPGLETRDWGLITIDEETGATSRRNIFAGGDAVVGPDLVVTAVAQGRAAAEAMHAYMMKDDKKATDGVAPED
jgi:glutamate synthase (NADPH/NADH) small chain